MELSGWGKYPTTQSVLGFPATPDEVLECMSDNSTLPQIARGLGRSYGDSSLAPIVISTRHLDHFINFNESIGELTCSSGVSFESILSIFVPKGWFFPVTPGTKFITVGGAIASDIHGKNHHIQGSFCDHVKSIKIATVSSGIIECSRDQHPELFHATCGGMGLTGVIIESTFKLKPIQSAFINETVIKARNLEEALYLFETNKESSYSVAWIDSIASGKSLGRSLLMLGEHSNQGGLKTKLKNKFGIPTNMPRSLLNRYTIQLANTLYYHHILKSSTQHLTHYDSFFYPLDRIHNWNRLYGKNGFIQYQFVIPKKAGIEGLSTILKRITTSKRGSFLTVLKELGNENLNYLSFPMTGYTLAMDFKIDKSLFAFLNELDSIVIDYGGRLYLSKDARMSENTFKQSYQHWERFKNIRKEYGADKLFNSLQSKRLGL